MSSLGRNKQGWRRRLRFAYGVPVALWRPHLLRGAALDALAAADAQGDSGECEHWVGGGCGEGVFDEHLAGACDLGRHKGEEGEACDAVAECAAGVGGEDA